VAPAASSRRRSQQNRFILLQIYTAGNLLLRARNTDIPMGNKGRSRFVF
jgi:hypothetical protein